MIKSGTLFDELRGVAAWLMPPTCSACGGNHPPGQPLCDDCHDALSTLPQGRCPLCALPYPEQNSTHLCGTCIQNPPPFSGVLALGCYEGTLKELVHRLKYNRLPLLDRPLGQLLADLYLSNRDDSEVDAFVPVPLHPRRLRQRTFNQSLLIARAMARITGHRVSPNLLRRTRTTELQQDLNALERQRNLKKAFQATADVRGARLLLVDDVMTTGATARACAASLIAAGAREVRVAVLARAARYLPA